MQGNEQKQNLFAQANKLQQMAQQLGVENLAEKAEMLVRQISDMRYFVTVVGEFSRGKSTLMNAVLGEAILPTALRPTTAVLNFIHKSEEKQVVVHYSEGREEIIPWTREAMKEFSALRQVDCEAVQYMELRAPLSGLPEDIVFVDTPGVNDVSEQRMDVTYRYIPLSDAVLFVLSARQPLSQSEWDFLQDFVSMGDLRQFFFVVNFKDTVDEDELRETLAGIRQRLTKLLPPEQIRLYPLAAKQAVAAREEGDEPALEASGYTAFQMDILQFLQSGERRQEKFARLEQQFSGLQQQLLEQIALQEQQMRLSQEEKQAILGRLAADKEQAAARMEELLAGLVTMQRRWEESLASMLQEGQDDFLQEQRVSIRAAETEKDFVRYTEEVLPLALQRYWKQWLEYRQERLLQLVNQDLQKLAQEYCNSFSARNIFFDLCQQAKVLIEKPATLYVADKEEVLQTLEYGQVGAAVLLGGLGLLSGYALAAIPLVAFGGNNLGGFLVQRFYIDDKLKLQQEKLLQELPGLVDDLAREIQQALSREFRQTAEKMEITLRQDFQQVWQELERQMEVQEQDSQQLEKQNQAVLLALQACRSEALALKEAGV